MSEQKIIPTKGELPSSYADRLGLQYTSLVTTEHKKENGQFFTPSSIATFMAAYSDNTSEHIKILDPGCGTAILTCALIEQRVKNNKQLKSIELTAYETDIDLIPFCQQSLAYLKEWLTHEEIAFSYILLNDDFILFNAKHLNNGSVFGSDKETFDIIISNPPYFKLSKDDKRTKAIKEIVNGQTNIYSAFMAVACKLLNKDGELIFITPRSFASGNYFKTFREFFFRIIQLEKIHLFSSRKDTFNRDSILQETMILKGRKKSINDTYSPVTVSSSHGLKDLNNPELKIYPVDELIDFNTREKMLHLPVNDFEERVIKIFRSWNGSLHKHHLQISTGPVVSFRAWNFISDNNSAPGKTFAPLFWLHNVNKMSLEWPQAKPNKGQYIQANEATTSILIPNKNYILLRRFSSKDDKSRLIAAPYFSNYTDADCIGVENKVNYIYRPKGQMSRNEIIGLCALLNSTLFDTYFRTFNGNVNVSATELREMPLPSLEIIKEIGDHVIILNDFSMEYIDNYINDHFAVNSALTLHEQN